MKYYIVEKNNNRAVHGVFDSLDRAKNHLKNIIPYYVLKGFFIDKTLTKKSFKILKVYL